MIWREKRILLIILGLLLAANAVFFFTYRVQYQSRLDELDERLAQADEQLRTARSARLTAERQYLSYRQTEADVKQVFDEYWSTEEQRLTVLLAEVKRLAQASSLVPKSYTFDRKAVDKQPGRGNRVATEIGASEVGVGFSVQGTYDQVRRLINLLELSRQFVIIDRIGLQSAQEQGLTLSLHIKTLFRDENALARERASRQRL
ncbi:MAG TPA: hypothetical protein VGF48_09850 [Thermoanaerobaculia bacterium]|jgi:Tfp pilus assembly protein PilO